MKEFRGSARLGGGAADDIGDPVETLHDLLLLRAVIEEFDKLEKKLA